MRNGRAGCRFCSGHAVDPAQAVEQMRALGYEPQVPYPGALVPWDCLCLVCGKSSNPQYGSTVHKGSRCKFCNPAGVNLNEPAIVYLVEHEEFMAFKIGISGVGKNRLAQHARQGWITRAQIDFATGRDALWVEQETKRWVRNHLGLPEYLGREEMPQGGATETFSSSGRTWQSVWAQVLKFVESAQI